MKAISFSQFGGPEVLGLADIAEPHPQAGEIRVRVRAAGVNPIDWKIRRGAMEQVFPTPLPSIPGVEIAGVVDEVGEGVRGVAPGDDVLGWAESGGYAELAIAQAFVRKPAELSWPVAAALPVAGDTAQRVLDELDVRAGETLLINGAAGSVGTLAVQLAHARGATVIGTASPPNQDYVRSLGAIAVPYGDGLVERVRAVAAHGVQAVFDIAGKGALPASVELAGGPSRVITISDPQAQKYDVRFSAGTGENRSIPNLIRLAEQVASGTIRIEVAQTFPLAAASEAQMISEAGHVRGKLVLLVQ